MTQALLYKLGHMPEPAVAERVLHAAEERVRTLTAQAEQVTSVWLGRRRGR